MKRQDIILDLSEAVECRLECSDCSNLLASYAADPFDIAEVAYDEGWRGDERHIKCPKCRRKK